MIGLRMEAVCWAAAAIALTVGGVMLARRDASAPRAAPAIEARDSREPLRERLEAEQDALERERNALLAQLRKLQAERPVNDREVEAMFDRARQLDDEWFRIEQVVHPLRVKTDELILPERRDPTSI